MNIFSTSTDSSSSTSSKKNAKKSSRHKPSSGLLKKRLNKRTIRRLNMKVARWERNAADPSKTSKRKKPQRLGGKVASRNKWDTNGLKKQIALLQERK
ncbi:MAG: hypothetical protein WC523_04265 [Patescibacteria group bacterium]